jgi:hypothetical protein
LVAIAIPVGLLAGGVVLYEWMLATQSRRWNDMRMTCEAMAQEASSNPKRPVLRGTPHPGNGWEDYEAAIALVGSRAGYLAADFLEGSPKADPSEVKEWVGTLAPALDRLRAGASKELVQRHLDWESFQTPWLAATQVAYLSACKARLLQDARRTTEAAELLLDTALFGEDWGRIGFESDAAYAEVIILTLVLDELRRLILSGDFGSEALEKIVRELEALDRGISSSAEVWFKGTVQLGFEFLRDGTVEAYMTRMEIKGKTPSAWRFGFSERIMMVDAFQTSLSAMRRYRQAADSPWPEARRLQAEAEAVWVRGSNPVFRMMTENRLDRFSPNDPHAEFRELRAQLRLLRTAAHYKATGEVLDLEDPFGEKLLHSSKGKSLRMWSVGPDGVDDGGAGEWRARGKDIVLEVGR